MDDSFGEDEENGTKVFARGLQSACAIFIDQNKVCEDYLRWMTPKLRQHYYLNIRRFGQGASLFVQGLQLQYGVDIPQCKQSALAVYVQAGKLGHFPSLCKQILLRLQINPEEEQDLEEFTCRWLKVGMNYVQDVRINFVEQVLQLSFEDILYLQEAVSKAKIGPLHKTFFATFLEIAADRDDETTVLNLKKLRELSLQQEHLPGLRLYLAILLQRKSLLESAEMAHVPNVIKYLQRREYHPAYTQCGKLMHYLGFRKEALKCFQTGWFLGGEGECLSWMIVETMSQIDFLKDLSIVANLTQNYLLLLLHMNNDLYEIIFIHNYLRKHLRGWKWSLEELLHELVKVIVKYQEMPSPKLMTLNSPAILVTYLNIYTPRLMPAQQDAKLMDLLKKIRSGSSSKDQCRLLMYFLMKLRRKNKLQEQLRICEYQYVQICRQTINDMEFPTAFYRYGKCLYRGYGVQENKALSYLLFSKVIEELEKRISKPFEIIRMSFVNYACAVKARGYLAKLGPCQQIKTRKAEIMAKVSEQQTCCICYTNENNCMMVPCCHFCCRTCFERLMEYKSTCPLCRKEVFSLSLKQLQ